MYTFEQTNDTKGGLCNVIKNGKTIAYLRIKYGIVTLYPVIDDEVAWGIMLKTWIFDDFEKKTLSKEELDKICNECDEPLNDFLSEQEVDDLEEYE